MWCSLIRIVDKCIYLTLTSFKITRKSPSSNVVSYIVAMNNSTIQQIITTVDREIFGGKNISSVPLTLKIEHAKYFPRRIIRTREIFSTSNNIVCKEMALLRYMKPIGSLPDPRGPLSDFIPTQAIAEANKEVEKVRAGDTKRGSYTKYSAADRAKIGKYACQHGAAAAARHFTGKFKKRLSESTVKSIKKGYIKELLKRRRADDGEELTAFPAKKRGRKLLLGNDLDHKVQVYFKKVREEGGAVSARIVMAAARGILLKCNRSMLVEFGGPIQLNRFWAHSLLKRMNFVQRKATTSKSKHTVENFRELKKAFLDDVTTAVTMEEIPPELILNWDQTGIKLVPSSSWTMEKCGEKRVEMVGINDKRQITAIFCGSVLGDFLPIQLIYKGKTTRCHPRFQFPPDWHITHSPNHWSTEVTMLQYIECIILPYVEKVRDDMGVNKAALVIMDNFKGQITTSVSSLLEDNNILVTLLPPNTTDLLQPMDISVNKPAKEYLRREFEKWYSEEVMKQLEGKDLENLEEAELEPINMGMPILKEIGAKWLVGMAEYLSDNPQFVVNGFLHSGIAAAIGRNEIECANIPSESEEIFSDGSYEYSSAEDVL